MSAKWKRNAKRKRKTTKRRWEPLKKKSTEKAKKSSLVCNSLFESKPRGESQRFQGKKKKQQPLNDSYEWIEAHYLIYRWLLTLRCRLFALMLSTHHEKQSLCHWKGSSNSVKENIKARDFLLTSSVTKVFFLHLTYMIINTISRK